MKVLHLCPLWFPISRGAPGGIETFLAHLVARLWKLGCQSTMLATGDSRTRAQLVPVTERGLHRLMQAGEAGEYEYYQQQQIDLALQHAHKFDIVHSHIGPAAYVLSAIPALRGRVLHTTHWPVGTDHQWFVRRHPDYWYSTVSEHQALRLRTAGATRCQAIHNAIDVARFQYQAECGNGLLYIGRMEAVKGPDLAVNVARQLERPLVLAGPIVEPDFFERSIVPYLNHQIRYVGVVDHRQKNLLFGEAACALLPFRGEEPFGMVAIEAMACGTPVVALARGALPEIVEPGLTGFLAAEESGLSELIQPAVALQRSAIRARVAARFDIAQTARQYLELYTRMVESEPALAAAAPVGPD